jgi:hypothetical protein
VPASNLETIVDALADAVEAITPTVLAGVAYARWRGPGILGEKVKPAPRHRQFQWQFGADAIPRSMSGGADASTWRRAELVLVVAYDLTLPRGGFDTNALGASVYEMQHDRDDLWEVLALGNPISSSTYHCKRMIPLNPWGTRSGSLLTCRFDLEYLIA